MGRWAEVYFTSPPEKREQAVLELLRELQGENSPHEDGIARSPSSVHRPAPELGTAPAPQIARDQQPLVRCPACGQENPATHRFCGMCGKPATEHGALDARQVADLHVTDHYVMDPYIAHPPSADLHVSDLHVADVHVSPVHTQDPPRYGLAAQAENNESDFVAVEDAVFKPSSTHEPPLFRSSRDLDYRADHNDEIFSYPSGSRSYRVYVGIALAIVIFALAYMAWRSMQATSQTAHVEPQAPPTVTTQPATPPPTISAKPDTPDETPPGSQEAAVPPNTEPATGKAEPRTRETKAANTARTQTSPTSPRSETLAGNGAEELATAQNYLNGANGQQRNRAEAAKWLWRAMAKHNADATILLSDLYLRGDGVSKNCDQARVLLDSAARGGSKDAAERLRHLQAFGCQ